ncbi:MAG: hypothetical protein A2X82_13090 [Geobacteraceae bacterium GWC2_55_20]|nr:MAG: hypothetical protein A2X82_13090 [Geobacteraceae bacterium GWC2_55_20]OGU24213.1 MAG: hypothetical protein A2X85_12625 [Geobacteraceae bacterium GWF2_54_21]HBA70782.1 hypothetical protein [Geobacter sp.]
MKKLFSLPIRVQLNLITLVIALPAIAIIVFTGMQQRNRAVSEAYSQTRQLAERVAAEQKNTASNIEQLLVTLAQLPDVKQQNKASIQPLLLQLKELNPEYANILVADLTGKVWAAVSMPPPPSMLDDRRYFRNAIVTGRLSSGEYVISKSIAKPVFHFAYPYRDPSGKIGGAIVVALSLEKYFGAVKKDILTEGSNILLLDHRGIILSRAVEPEKAIGRKYPEKPLQEMFAGPEEYSYRGVGSLNDERFISYRKIRLEGESTPYMYVRVGVPVEPALAKSGRFMATSIAFFSVFLFGTLMLAYLIGKRSISDRIGLLQKASNRFAEGDLQVRVSGSVAGGELGELARSFDSMADKLAEREKVIQESEVRLRSITDSANDAILMVDPSGAICYWNPAAETILGYRANEVLGENLHRLLAPKRYMDDHRAAFQDFVHAGIGGVIGRTVELSAIRKGGLEIPVSLSLSSVLLNGEWHAVGVLRDISELKRAEKELRESEERFKALSEASFGGIIIHDKGLILECNKGLSDITGFSYAEHIGMNGLELIAPESLDTVLANIRSGYDQSYEVEGVRKDGSRYPLAIRGKNVTYKGRDVRVIEFRDITSRKRAEAEHEKLQLQLNQAQKLESVGRLAGGVAHEFNNKLMVIMGSAELAHMHIHDHERLFRYLNEITRAAEYSRDITAQLLAFSRKNLTIAQVVNPNRIIEETVKTLPRLIGEQVRCTFLLADNVWSIRIDPVQLDQIIMNMAVNARDAMPDGGDFSIATCNHTLDKSDCESITAAVPGEYVRISFRDSGVGMDSETISRIFEPFFTTKEIGKGTGLGLATIYGIVRQNDGYIQVVSQPGQGAEFHVYLPRHRDAPHEKLEEDFAPLSGSESILLVEDEEAVRKMVLVFLQTLGYTVHEAISPSHAIELAADRSIVIDLVITDVIMPEMNGKVMMDRIEEKRPGIRSIYVSGYSSDVLPIDGERDGLHFIQKPYKMKQLSEYIRTVMK